MTRTLFFVGALACAAMTGLAPATVGAQDRVPARIALARIAVSESGWDGKRDRVAIWHLLQRRADRHGMSLGAMARAYSTRVFDPRRDDPRRWVAMLDARHAITGSRAPESFPARLSWARYRNSWVTILAHADAFLGGHTSDPCGTPPDHWGMSLPGSIDFRRAVGAGWERVDCGSTANAFWQVPRTVPASRARARRRRT